jgi:hypothetical protein
MPHHFTKLTVEATFWCAKCGTSTLHRVDGGRRGPCLKCIEKLSQPKPPALRTPEQLKLF